jgi:hypothetical protein
VCANCGHGGQEHGFQRSASLTTIALETIRIARQLIDQAVVDKLSVGKESWNSPGRGYSSVATLAKRDVPGKIHLRVVSGEVMSKL